jgi:hypothetical protein
METIGTYEVVSVVVQHSELGDLNKQYIYYYDLSGELILVEYYDGEVREGYLLK